MPRSQTRGRDGFSALGIHEQYYGFSKVVNDAGKTIILFVGIDTVVVACTE